MIPTEQGIKRSKKTPRWLLWAYSIIAIMVICGIILQLFLVVEFNLRTQRAIDGYYKTIYCNSLCPVEAQYNDYKQLQRFFDASCKNNCAKNYLDVMKDNEKEELNRLLSGERNISSNFINYTSRYLNCEQNLKANLSFYYVQCFQELFYLVSKETDLREVLLPSFQSYFFDVEEARCGEYPSITVKRIRGQGNASLSFIINGDGKKFEINGFQAPAVGESKNYLLKGKRNQNITHIGIVAFDSLTNRSITNIMWKECSRA